MTSLLGKAVTSAGGSQAGASSAGYVGRFAPSPTGPLHAGSLVAAMASYLDARAHQGRWLLRMEDVDKARTVPGAAASIINTVAALGMQYDSEILWQSARGDAYAAAFRQLQAYVYPCACSRREIADSQARRRAHLITDSDASTPLAIQPYPGTCRHGMLPGRLARAWRLRVPAADEAGVRIGFKDRFYVWQEQDLARDSGDFVLRRADGFWAYQLAVVTDDAAQGITHVVRGMDLLESTPRQIYLQRLLGVPTPIYLHTPLVCNASGEKLSKQTGAAPLDLTCVEATLVAAARVLGLELAHPASPYEFWQRAIPMWAARYLAAEP